MTQTIVDGLEQAADLRDIAARFRSHWHEAPIGTPLLAFKVGVLSPQLAALLAAPNNSRLHLSTRDQSFAAFPSHENAKWNPLLYFSDKLHRAMFPEVQMVYKSSHLFDNKGIDELGKGYATGCNVHRDVDVFHYDVGKLTLANDYNAGINVFACSAPPGSRLYSLDWRAHPEMGELEYQMFRESGGRSISQLQGSIKAYEAYAREHDIGIIDTAPFDVWVMDSDMPHRAVGLLPDDPVSTLGLRRQLAGFYRWLEPKRVGWVPPR